jgi:pantoate--beta-alanine ligase
MGKPEVLTRRDDVRAWCNDVRAHGRGVGFVPTMGALHAGHRSLAQASRDRGLVTIASIFVNPTQFGPNEDFDRYPRDLDADVASLEPEGVAAVFAPSVEEMYPAGDRTTVSVRDLTAPFCGRFRPGHFDGVTTIVARLFAIVGPSSAFFGRKDYQQVAVIRRMTTDLALPVEVVPCATVREPDGLAMSSRNRYLAPEARHRALSLARGLHAAAVAYGAGERSADVLSGLARAEVAASMDRIDYVELGDADSLAPLAGKTLSSPAVLAIAAHLGTTRLIDNIVLGEDPSPLAQVRGGA